MCNPEQEIRNALKPIEKVGRSIENTLKNIARDPLPVIQTIALTYALGPSGAGLSTGQAALATSAAIAAANGGKVEDIALNMAAAYAGSQIGEYAGASMPPETTAMVKQVVISASASAATTALRGGDFNQILASGVSGSVNAYVATSLKEQGFTNLDTKLIANASSAATSAILNGRSVSDALAQSVTATVLTAAIQGQVDQLNKNNELGQSLASNADSLAKEADKFFNKYFAPDKVNLLRDVQISTKELNFEVGKYNRTLESMDHDLGQYNRFAAIAEQDPNNTEAVALANGYAKTYAERWEYAQTLVPAIEYRKADYDKITSSYNKRVDEYTTQYVQPLVDLNTQYETLVAQTTELSTSLADNVFKYQEELKLNSNDLAEQIGKQALEEATKLLTPSIAPEVLDAFNANYGGGDVAARIYQELIEMGQSPGAAQNYVRNLVNQFADNYKPEPVPEEPVPEEPVPEVPPAESETPVTDTVATTDEPLPPVEPTPVEPTPVEPVPEEPVPVEPVPEEPVPEEPVPVEPVPVEPVPVEPVPEEPTPEEPVPVEPVPDDSEIPEIVITAPREPVEPEPEEPTPVEPVPEEPEPEEPTPVEPVPEEPTPKIPADKYPVQDLNIPQENIDEYQKNLQDIWDTGGFTSQWQPTEEGGRTLTDDSGSTITLDETGKIIGYTEAAPGMLLKDWKAQQAAIKLPPSGTPKTPVTPVTPVTPKTTTPAAKTGGLDIAALMTLLASMDGNTNQPPATPPPLVDIGEQFDINSPLETNPFAKPQTQTKMARGGSIDDLLALLRRG